MQQLDLHNIGSVDGGGGGNGINNTDWLNEVLEETGLQQFHTKLANDLQLTKLSHFDYVSEEDLIQLGLSKPAARRLLAAIKKRKSFVTALKNKIVNKLIPATTTLAGTSSQKHKHQHQHHHREFFMRSTTSFSGGSGADKNKPTSEFGRLTCLINSQDLQIKEEIGNGVHGFVKKGEWTTPNGRVVEVALKILKKDVMSEPGASFNEFVKEISVMHQLNHPNIIKLYGVVLSSPMMMVTELAPFGNLRDKLRKENGSTPISQMINFGVQIASGMQYLELKRFVHRDLAARNIFISHGKKILIGDLGLMRAIPTQDDHYVMSERTKIPYPWCAPESLKFKQFSSSSDVYMFGVTLWEMFSFGKEPWAGLNMNQILENISSQKKRMPCPEACPTMVYQTLLQCWNTEPNCRPNFVTLYQYLSTSYPLEVRSNQHISEMDKNRANAIPIPEDDDTDDHSTTISSPQKATVSASSSQTNKSTKKVLNCNVDDRILVIDGQPEKYWWKGQNQRTFEIGWFPLSSTRWLAPKRGTNYISKPLKNSFVHTGHCGADARWGNPLNIDRMYLKNPLQPDDIDSFKVNRFSSSGGGGAINSHLSGGFLLNKNKTKSRLSKLFGIQQSESSSTKANSDGSGGNQSQLLPRAYHKFINEQSTASPKQAIKLSDNSRRQLIQTKNSLIRSQSTDLRQQSPDIKPVHDDDNDDDQDNDHQDDEPPLINFDEEPQNSFIPDFSAFRILESQDEHQQQPLHEESLIDMDGLSFPTAFPDIEQHQHQHQQRRASDTKLDQIDENNYHLSWAGSWNTGTFYGSSSNIYSAYYCPQDAAIGGLTSGGVQSEMTLPNNTNTNCVNHQDLSNRYYSAVVDEDCGLNLN